MKFNSLKLFVLTTLILISGSYFNPTPAHALATCGTVDNPEITVNINGTDYTSNASVTVPKGTAVSFNVKTYAEPSSVNTISYPVGSNIYPGPNRSTGRNYTTVPINSSGETINVWVDQNCQEDWIDADGPHSVPRPEYEMSVTLNIPPENILPVCSISSFTADNLTPPNNTGTTLRFSFQDTSTSPPSTTTVFPWDISLLSVANLPTPNSGTGVSGTSSTGNLTQSQTYRLTCGNDISDLTVTVPSSGRSKCTGTNQCGWDPNDSGPAQCSTNADCGSTSPINGSCSTSHYNCSAGVSSGTTGDTSTAWNWSCNSPNGGTDASCSESKSPAGPILTPTITAPSCSNTNYSVQISWPGVSGNISIFVDDNGSSSSFWKSPVDGTSGSTSAPSGFNQRIPGAPQTLVFQPGVRHYAFINNGSTSGPTVSWIVNPCQQQASGYLDTNASGTNNCSFLGGWAWDPDFPNNATSVHIYKNSVFYDAIAADANRGDLPGNHKHAFTYPIPSDWKTGTNQTINVYVIDLNGDGNPELNYSPATLNCV